MARRSVALLALGVGLAAGIALGSLGDRFIDAPANEPLDQSQVASITSAVIQDDELTAERNLYPAPQTVIAMADRLGLDQTQRRQLYELQQKLDSETVLLIRRILREERRLDRAFADGALDAAHIDAAAMRIGGLKAQLRAVRLRAHVATRNLLYPKQILRFAELHGFEPTAATEEDELDR